MDRDFKAIWKDKIHFYIEQQLKSTDNVINYYRI